MTWHRPPFRDNVGVVHGLPLVTKVFEKLFDGVLLVVWAREEVAKAGLQCFFPNMAQDMEDHHLASP